MHTSFPLYPTAMRDSGGSFTDTQKTENLSEVQNGTDSQSALQNGMDHDTSDVLENGLDRENDSDKSQSTEDLLKSLDAIQNESMKTFEELIGKLAEITPEQSPNRLHVDTQDILSRSLPSHYFGSNQGAGLLHQGGRSVSPSYIIGHSRSPSGDLVLNPSRTESDV